MRKKVGILLEENLYRQVKRLATSEGKSVSALIEEALRLRLAQPAALDPVTQTWGMFHLPPEEIHEIALLGQEDPVGIIVPPGESPLE